MTVTFLQGDVSAMLKTLPDEHFDCVVTSPPYWGLRDYGIKGQLGLEPTLSEHLSTMVNVFAEVHRVLKPTGTLFVNYGDCYATTPNGRSAADTKALSDDDRTFRDKPFSTIGPVCADGPPSTITRGENGKNPALTPSAKRIYAGGTLKPKDLCMVPNRFALAMQDWGWWVRSEIIWAKPNPMPESITDRPATAHEKIFMFTKSAKYFYDADAVRVKRKTNGAYKTPDGWDTGEGAHGSFHRKGREKGSKAADQMSKAEQTANCRNLRNYEPAPNEVWKIATKPFSEAHFATFPPELVERCLLAGCPENGNVLDPFGGAGTTALVADKFQRDCTLIELNSDYLEIARKRIDEASRQPDLFTEAKPELPEKQLELLA